MLSIQYLHCLEKGDKPGRREPRFRRDINNPGNQLFSSPEHNMLKVSFSDNSMSIVRHASSVFNIYLVDTLEATCIAHST